jgi:hypothetical protein
MIEDDMTNTTKITAGIDLDKPDNLAALLCCLYEGPEIPRAAAMLVEQAMQIEELSAELGRRAGPSVTAADERVLRLMQNAARAWNNENEPALDAAMEEIETFLLDQRKARAALASPAVSQKDGAAFCPKDVGVCGQPSYCVECPHAPAATTASASIDLPAPKFANVMAIADEYGSGAVAYTVAEVREIAGGAPAPSRNADAFAAAVDAEYPLPDNPHASVIQRATDNRAAMWRGINAARAILVQQGASQAPLPPCRVSRWSDTKERGVLAVFDRRLSDEELEALRAALTRAPLPAQRQGGALTDAQIIAALHANAIDTYPSKYGFDAVQVSATSVPSLRKVIESLAAPAQAGDARNVGDLPDDWKQVLDEVTRATRKFPTWPTDPLHAVAVLGEEFGELTKAILQTTYEPHKVADGELRTEAIQTAAMSLRFLASLEHYEFARSRQHEQGIAAIAAGKDGA